MAIQLTVQEGGDTASGGNGAYLIWLLLASLLFYGCDAVSASSVGLLDAVRVCLARNPDLQIQTKQVEYSRGVAQQKAGPFDSVLSLSAARVQDNSPLNQQSREAYAGAGFPIDQLRSETTQYGTGLERRLRSGWVLGSSVGVVRTAGTLNDINRLTPQIQGKIDFTLRIPLLKNEGREAATNESAAMQEMEASQWELRFKVSQTVLNTVMAYWGLLAAYDNLDIAREAETGVARMLGDMRKLVEADELPAADLHVIRANLQDKRATRLSMEQYLHDARQWLGQIMGLSISEIVAIEPADAFPVCWSSSASRNGLFPWKSVGERTCCATSRRATLLMA